MGVLEHIGSTPSCGHYTFGRQLQGSTWAYLNDASHPTTREDYLEMDSTKTGVYVLVALRRGKSKGVPQNKELEPLRSPTPMLTDEMGNDEQQPVEGDFDCDGDTVMSGGELELDAQFESKADRWKESLPKLKVVCSSNRKPTRWKEY